MQPPSATLGSLSQADSFVAATSVKIFGGKLRPDEVLFGVYRNTDNDVIAITDRGLHWLHDGNEQLLDFASFAGVRYDFKTLKRGLSLELNDGTAVVLPILNETDDDEDIAAFYEFLISVMNFQKLTSSDRIAAIESRNDLVSYLREDIDVSQIDIENAVRELRPTNAELTQLKIDPAILEREDLWRLIAFLLTSDLQSSLKQSGNCWMLDTGDLVKMAERAENRQSAADPRATRFVQKLEKQLNLSVDMSVCLHIAEDETREMGHSEITPAFIMLGITRGEPKLTQEVLQRPFVTTTRMRKAVRRASGYGPFEELSRRRPLSVPSIDVLEAAVAHAARLGSQRVEPEHVLDTLLLNSAGTAHEVLSQLDTDQRSHQ